MKKDEARFTIRFCLADPRHKRIVDALNAAGRRKASFIVDAGCEYLERNGISNIHHVTSSQIGTISMNIPISYEAKPASNSENSGVDTVDYEKEVKMLSILKVL